MSTAVRSLVRIQSTSLGLPRAFRPASSILLRRTPAIQTAPPVFGCRFHSSDAAAPPQPRSLTDRKSSPGQDANSIAVRKALEPAYEMSFTCTKCQTRSSHRITKQAYHHGTVLVNCPGCKNRHLISDHMKIFSDKSITIEDIMREKGQYIRKGSLGADGDIEFYDEEGSQAKEPEKPT